MARRVRRKIKRPGFFSKIKFTESYTSLILGAIVVLIVGILFISFAGRSKNPQTSSTREGPIAQEQESQNSQTSSIYTINPGDDLWSISENVYNNGYEWIEIAKANKLENPGLIHAGNKLNIPVLDQNKQIAASIKMSPESESKTVGNISITGNTYVVINGDNLWDIAVRAYGDGFKWPEIAKVNNLKNPNIIHPGNVFNIPR